MTGEILLLIASLLDEPPMGVRIPATRPAEQFWNAAGTAVRARWSVVPPTATLGQPRTLRLIVGPLDNPDDILAPDLTAIAGFSKSFRIGKPTIGPGDKPADRAISWAISPLRIEANTIPALPYRYFDPKRRVPEDRWELRFPTTQIESLSIVVLPDVAVRPPRSPLILPALATELVSADDAPESFRVRGWMWWIGPVLVGSLAGYRRWNGSDRRAVLLADRRTRQTLRQLRRAGANPVRVREIALTWCERHYRVPRQSLPPDAGRLVEIVDAGTFAAGGKLDVREAIDEIERIVVSESLSGVGVVRSV